MTKLSLTVGLVAGGAPVIWQRVVMDALPLMRTLVPAESKVLEIGYGNGLLSCWLSKELKWRIMGLDVLSDAQREASENARRMGIDNNVLFICCNPEETWRHHGQYDAVFIKTVLYNAPDLGRYGKWLDWVLSVLRPGGLLVNFETGRANGLMQFYRRVRRRKYTDLCLYTREVEALYDNRFDIVERRYYGGWSQFFAPIPWLYSAAYRFEEAIRERNADNSFIVSIIARKRVGES